jgi:hypothetical protein
MAPTMAEAANRRWEYVQGVCVRGVAELASTIREGEMSVNAWEQSPADDNPMSVRDGQNKIGPSTCFSR